jgi:hypothetical protein
MWRKLAFAAVFVMLLAIMVSGASSQASTCKKVVITVMDHQYYPPPFCYNLPSVGGPTANIPVSTSGGH